MSEEIPWYNQTLTDGPWSVRWSVRPDLDARIGITIKDESGATAIPLTRERAELLRRACEEVLRHAPWVAGETVRYETTRRLWPKPTGEE